MSIKETFSRQSYFMQFSPLGGICGPTLLYFGKQMGTINVITWPKLESIKEYERNMNMTFSLVQKPEQDSIKVFFIKD